MILHIAGLSIDANIIQHITSRLKARGHSFVNDLELRHISNLPPAKPIGSNFPDNYEQYFGAVILVLPSSAALSFAFSGLLVNIAANTKQRQPIFVINASSNPLLEPLCLNIPNTYLLNNEEELDILVGSYDCVAKIFGKPPKPQHAINTQSTRVRECLFASSDRLSLQSIGAPLEEKPISVVYPDIIMWRTFNYTYCSVCNHTHVLKKECNCKCHSDAAKYIPLLVNLERDYITNPNASKLVLSAQSASNLFSCSTINFAFNTTADLGKGSITLVRRYATKLIVDIDDSLKEDYRFL
jgi:hypothetical protein